MRARPSQQRYRTIAVSLLVLSTSILIGCSTASAGNNSGPSADATDTPYVFISSTLPPTVPVYYPTATTPIYYPTATTSVYHPAPTPTTPVYHPTATPSPTTPPPTPTATQPPPPASATVINFAYTPSIASCYLSFDIENTSNVVASNVYYTDSISGNGVTVSGGAGVGDIAAGGSVSQSFPVNFVNFNGFYTDISISVYEYGQGGTYIGGGSATILHC